MCAEENKLYGDRSFCLDGRSEVPVNTRSIPLSRMAKLQLRCYGLDRPGDPICESSPQPIVGETLALMVRHHLSRTEAVQHIDEHGMLCTLSTVPVGLDGAFIRFRVYGCDGGIVKVVTDGRYASPRGGSKFTKARVYFYTARDATESRLYPCNPAAVKGVITGLLYFHNGRVRTVSSLVEALPPPLVDLSQNV